jgi:methionyl-tRNA synthetase
MDALDLRTGAALISDLVTAANLHVAQTAPWALAKAGNEAELDRVLGALVRGLYRLAILASPFLPDRAQLLWEALGQPGRVASADWATLGAPPVAGCAIKKPDGLFPKPAPGPTG